MPVKTWRSLQLNLQAVKGQAEIILKNKKQPKMEDQHSKFGPLSMKEDGRHMKTFVLDLHSAARNFEDNVRFGIETKLAEAEAVCPRAFAIPTTKAVDWFDARMYSACYIECGSATAHLAWIAFARCSSRKLLVAFSSSRSTHAVSTNAISSPMRSPA